MDIISIMSDPENTPIVTETPEPPTNTNSLPPGTNTVTSTTPTEPVVRNPEKLLELFNQQKVDLAELKKYKTDREQELATLEQDRLKKEQQYEALIPIKIQEAIKPYVTELENFKSAKVTLENQLLEAQSKYQMLQDSLLDASLKESLYAEFLKSDGDPKTSKDALWKLYGDSATVKEGKIEGLTDLIKTIQSDTIGSRLFTVKQPNGTGTPPQTKTGVTQDSPNTPRSVTKAMLLNPRKHGFSTEDIISGKVIVEG